MNAVIPIIRSLGDIGQIALPTGAIFHAHSKGYKKEAATLGAMWGLQQIPVFALKAFTKVARPFPNHLFLDSFPSGHTAGAFLALGFLLTLDLIQGKNSDKPYLHTAAKILLTVAAFFVGISRYIASMHWPLDIAVGVLVGLSFGAAAALIPSCFSKETSPKKCPSNERHFLHRLPK